MDDLDTPSTKETERPLEKSPQERYVRFETRLGSGAYKTVYKAYDTDQGIDVAWNAIDIASLPAGEKARIIQEVQLLQKLEHKNIINFYGSWFSKEKNQVVFITEIMTSGTLKSYIKRVQFVKLKIIKRWCIQILEGLDYLHSQTPPIIHRDLKCDNIFINGNTGDLRIGDLGLSTQMAVTQRAQSVLGTPEFMAPELYDENYDEKVDIYAFGMCVLEMMTKDVPYSECMNPAQIYKKVIAGIRPKGLQRIISDSARDFIELCLSRGDGKIDVTAKYLMTHTFLQTSENDDDHDLARPTDEEDLPPIEQEKEPSNEEMSQELNMEKNVSGAARRSSVPLIVSKTEAIVEPISGESKDDDAADQILAAMPGNESKVQDERVNVMVGRGERMKTTSTGQVRSMIDKPTSTQCVPLRQHAASVSEISDQETLPPRAPKLPPTPTPPVVDVPRSKTPPPMRATPPVITTASSVSSSAGNSPTGGDDPQPVKVVDSTTRRRSQRHDIKSTVDPENEHSILLNLRIMIDGKSKEIKFSFNLFTDVPHEVASELAADVGIPEPEVAPIVDSICYLVTEGKIKNLTQMEFDVWEDAPEPHSFSLKKLAPSKKDVKKEISASIPLSRSNSEQGIVASNPTELNSRNMVTSAFDQNDLEAAIRNEEEKHQREMVRYRLKMEEFERKKQQAAVARQQRMEQVAAEFKAEVQAERSKWPERISSTAGMNAVPTGKPPSSASLDQDPST